MSKIKPLTIYMLLLFSLIAVLFLSVVFGSVRLNFADITEAIRLFIKNGNTGNTLIDSILFRIRIPRALSVMLLGAGLALCGASMQGLLQNPMADGSTLGVASGASLGAVLSIALQASIPYTNFKGTGVFAIIFALTSLSLVIGLSYSFDKNLSTNTIILVGVIFGIFASSLISLVIAFSMHRVQNITLWTMGSIQGVSYEDFFILLITLLIFGAPLLFLAPSLNALAISEKNALHIGVNVKRVKLLIMICVCVIIGIFVSIAGPIGFVGLIIPHLVRLMFSSNHVSLLPQSMLLGAVFLLLCDLIARAVIPPKELPLGVITSIVGTVFFIGLFIKRRGGQSRAKS